MLTGPLLLVVFVVSVALLLLLIIRFQVNAFLALLLAAIVTAFLVGMPVGQIGSALTRGFGNTLAGIGIVIGLGIILGRLLLEAGATDQIANQLIRAAGEKHSPLAINGTGYLTSIPVFFDAAFVIFMPLVSQVARRTAKPVVTYVAALSIGLITTHCMVIPTPGPLAVAENMNLDPGLFLLVALAASIPASLTGGWLYGLFLGRNAQPETPLEMPLPAPEREAPERPSGGLSLGLLLLPVLLILVGSLGAVLLPEGSALQATLAFAGDKNIALLLGVLLAVVLLKRYITKPANEVIVEAAASAGLILLITGAGGSFGYIINESGIGPYLVETMEGWNVSALFLGFILAALLRGAQGSATVALVTVSAILGPTVATTGVSPVLAGVAVCAGSMCASLPNDSAFWVVSRFADLTVRETMRVWTLGGTIGGAVGFAVVLLLDGIGLLTGI